MAKQQFSRGSRILASLLLAVAMLVGFIPVHQALAAHPPQQAGDQPGFVTATYVAPSGDATIESQETTLTAQYLATAGTLQGLELSGDAIILSPGQPTGTFTSGTIEAPLTSTTDIVPVWSAELPAGSQLLLETRVRAADGSWSEWVANPEAFFPVRDNQHGGSLIWIGGGRAALQFRATLSAGGGAAPVLRSITLTFSNTQSGPDAASIAAQMDMSSAGGMVCPPPKPPVVPRTMWGCPDGENSPRRAPTYAPVTHVVIHHTATPNSPYQDWAQVVRSVWNYHANTLWWGDVGYNYLIDPNGVIYEGRAGGDDVVGIHDTVNQGSMAIGFIGCYGNCNYLGLANAQPSTPMLNSGAALAAWKVAQKQLNPHGVTQYDGAGLLPTIAGGRDVTATFSPGDYLYDKLPWIRDTVAQYVNCGNACQVTDVIFDKDQYAIDETIYLTVKLEDAQGVPLPGANVRATVTRIAEGTAASPLDLVDLTGYYQGTYTDTSVPGTYAFEILASDPSGRFAPCSASGSTTVGGAPAGTLIKVEPEHLVTSWCSFQAASSISVYEAADIDRVYLELDYDPAVVQVVDADPFAWGVQVRLGGGLLSRPTSVLRNEVDTDNGHIYFEATMLSDQNIQDAAGLIMVDWRPQLPGISPVLITRAELTTAAGQVLVPAAESGTVDIVPDCLMGTVLLQGRTDNSGVTVTTADGAVTRTEADGQFGTADTGPITVNHAGYLSAVADPANAAQMGETGSSLGTITLLAGDLNQDNVINIFDLAMIANQLDTSDGLADLNVDGIVNILDVAMIAGNFGIQGPQRDWQ